MMFGFGRKKPDFDHALSAMLTAAVDAADNLAAMAPDRDIAPSELVQLEAFVADKITSDARAFWERGPASPVMMAMIWPGIEARFRQAFHDRLYASVTINAMQPEGTA